MKVYRYGLLSPIENALLVERQMRAGHRYRNTLTEIERGRRWATRKVESEAGDAPALELALKGAREVEERAVRALKSQRAKTKSRSDTKEQREAVRIAREERKRCADALAEYRRQLREDPEIVRQRDQIGDLDGEIRRAARANCNTYWGTYLLVEDAMNAASKAPLYDEAEPNDPRFVRWIGKGSVGVQIQKGILCREVFGNDRRLRIDPVDPRAWDAATSRGERRRLSRTTLRMRVDSDDAQAPIWAAWPMIMHRPLSVGGKIKRAVVQRRMIGPREEWSVCITVDEPPPIQIRTDRAIAIDLGWRVVPEGIRVGMCWDGSRTRELALDGYAISGLRKPEELRSVRDDNFNVERARLRTWMDQQTQDLPAWLVERTKTLDQWRAPSRLAALTLYWRDRRFDGDEEIYTAMEAWRRQDRHLWLWETSQRSGALRHRREVFRRWAVSLAIEHDVLVLEDFDLSRIARRSPAESEKSERARARANRQLVAVSELRLALEQAFVARGKRAVRVPAQETTTTCHACGVSEAFDAATLIRHACDACGIVWDQDENAARVILARWRTQERERSDDTDPSQGARTDGESESRWARAKRRAAEKRARSQAREEGSGSTGVGV